MTTIKVSRLLWIATLSLIECSVLTYHYGDGSYFKGTVDSHGRPSQGEFYNEDGILTYNGSFKAGQYDGYGVMYGEDGAQYQGSFRSGEMTGEGMWLDTQHGEMIQGSFDNGTVTGVAVWERQDGVRFEGVFRRGHAHGPGLVTWYGDGYRMTTEFKKGYPHGPAELLNLENETIWSGDFWNGVVISSDSDEEVGEDVRSRLMFGVTVCLDSRVSCSQQPVIVCE